MPEIPFIQYMMPDGRPVPRRVDRPCPVALKACLIVAVGYRLECEVFQTGEVSLTIADPREDVDVAIEVCANGPEVSAAVDRLILGFDLEGGGDAVHDSV